MERFYFSKFMMESYDEVGRKEHIPIYGLIPEDEEITRLQLYSEPFVQTYGTPQEVGRDLRARLPPNKPVSFIWDETFSNTVVARGEAINLENIAKDEFYDFLDAYLNKE